MLTQISKTIATTTEPLVLLTLAIIISIFLYAKNQKSQAYLLALTSIVTAAIIKILKNIIQAPRPTTMLIQETGYSFPSGHATFSIIFLGLITYIFIKPKYKIHATIISTILVIIISLSRLQLQAHHPIDIFAGLIIGSIILTASILLHKKLTKY